MGNELLQPAKTLGSPLSFRNAATSCGDEREATGAGAVVSTGVAGTAEADDFPSGFVASTVEVEGDVVHPARRSGVVIAISKRAMIFSRLRGTYAQYQPA